MRGIDQLTNLIIEDSHERVYTTAGVSMVELGLYIARGDNMYVVSSTTTTKSSSMNRCNLSLSLSLSHITNRILIVLVVVIVW
jgi:hypothetical protein